MSKERGGPLMLAAELGMAVVLKKKIEEKGDHE